MLSFATTLCLCVWMVAVRAAGIEFQQPDSVTCGRPFTIAWQLAEPAQWTDNDQIVIELCRHRSFTDTPVLKQLARVRASDLCVGARRRPRVLSVAHFRFFFFVCRQYVWQIDSSVPVQWQNVPLVLRLHKADAPAVNNVPTEVSYWVTFNLVCLEPALRVAQPPAVHCGDALTVRWEYLDTAKRMWSTADRVVLELWAHTGVRSFDFRIATLAQDVAYPTASYRWVVPKQLPQQ